jgi:ABC-type glycerol-3-phosphate transport system substrate-binding protein
MFHRSWLPKHKDKIFALSKTKIPLTKFQQLFPDVAAEDFSDGENVYALPIYIDTLSLIYNKDIFNSSAVAMPPKTWDEFKILIPKIRKIDNRTGAILRAAGAIGGTQNSIHNASDILDLIMMQFGVSFPKSAAEKVSLRDAEEALNFYTDFANASSLFYTWDDKFGDSLEVFSNGKTAIIFDYQSIIKNLKEKNPYLNIKSSPMLQFDLDNPINYPNYWGLAISNKSRNPIAAQDFILAFTTDEKIAEAYLKSSGHPPALRSLIARYQNDPDLGIFTKQALSARSWYQIDYNFINQTFSDMIESVIMNRSSIKDALEIAQNKINSFSISQ